MSEKMYEVNPFDYEPVYPAVVEVITGEELKYRMGRLIDYLPRLKLEYNAKATLIFKGRLTVTEQELRQVLNDLSLRDTEMIDYSREDFDSHFNAILDKARHRGSHI